MLKVVDLIFFPKFMEPENSLLCLGQFLYYVESNETSHRLPVLFTYDPF
jgi:hypothetical protein